MLHTLTRRDWLSPLTGLGQIMFQESPITGLFFLIGLAVAAPMIAAGAALAVVVGTVTAAVLKFDREELRAGLFGFNASLVGMALVNAYQSVMATWLLILVGSILSTPLTLVMRRNVPFPTYTTPFIVTTWLMLAVAQAVQIPASEAPALPQATSLQWESAVLDGVGEVMFQANHLSGILFLVGILLCSWKGAVWAAVGSLLGALLATWHHDDAAGISMGIYGYNAALAAMALALYRPKSLTPPLLGALLTVPLVEFFPSLHLATLTAPFVLASWLVIGLEEFNRLLYPQQHHETAVPGR